MKKIILTTLITASIFSSQAFAIGQGAIAGSASMFLTTSKVSHVSSSIAIGKANAYTNGNILLGATAPLSTAKTSSIGASDAISFATANSVVTTTVAEDTALASPQLNILEKGTVSLNPGVTPAFNGILK